MRGGSSNLPCLQAASAKGDQRKVDDLFSTYRDRDETEDVIGPEGEWGLAGGASCRCKSPPPPLCCSAFHHDAPLWPPPLLPPPGIIQFCKDLGVDPQDRKTLLLAWKASEPRGWCCSPRSRQPAAASLQPAAPLIRTRCSLTLPQMGAQRQGFFSKAEFQ